MPLHGQVLLAPDHKDRIGHPRLVQVGDGLVVQVHVEVEAHNFRRQGIVERLHGDLDGDGHGMVSGLVTAAYPSG